MERKDFIRSMAFGALSSSVLLAACGGNNSTTNTPATTAPEKSAEPSTPPANTAANCNDLTGLTEADLQQRTSLGYVEKTDDPAKMCSNCRFYQAGTQPNGCGGCTLFKGPVNEGGNCKSWFAKS